MRDDVGGLSGASLARASTANAAWMAPWEAWKAARERARAAMLEERAAAERARAAMLEERAAMAAYLQAEDAAQAEADDGGPTESDLRGEVQHGV